MEKEGITRNHRLCPLYLIPELFRFHLMSPQYLCLTQLHPYNAEETNDRLMLDLIRYTGSGYLPLVLLMNSCNQSARAEWFQGQYERWKDLYMHIKSEYDRFMDDVRLSLSSLSPLPVILSYPQLQETYDSIKDLDQGTYAKVANEKTYYAILFQFMKEKREIESVRCDKQRYIASPTPILADDTEITSVRSALPCCLHSWSSSAPEPSGRSPT